MQSIAESLVDEPLETPADLDRIDLESAWDDAVRDESAEGVEELSDATPVSLPEGFQESASSPQTLRVPHETSTLSGVGEQTSVATSTGTMGFSIPLGPLSLAHTPGLAGGWSFSTQYIARRTDRGAPRYDDRSSWHLGEDLFALSGGEELEAVDSAAAAAVDCAGLGSSCGSYPADVAGWQEYRARIEGGFRRVFRSPDSRRWVVLSPDGSRQDYGALAEGEGFSGVATTSLGSLWSESSGGEGRVFRWSLTRSVDRHGAATWYIYAEDRGNRYLTDVYAVAPWNGCGELGSVSARMRCAAPLSSYGTRAHVVWEPRPDVTTSYRSTWAVVTGWRIRRVVTSAALGAPGARHYTGQTILEYSSASHISRLDRVISEARPSVMSPLGVPVSDWSVTEEQALATEALGGERLPPLELSYTEQPTAHSIAGYGGFDATVHRMSAPPGAHRLGEADVDLFDVNSDGLPDLVATQPDRYRTSGGRVPAVGVYFNGFRGAEARPAEAGDFSGAVLMGLPAGMSTIMQLSRRQLRAMDWDGDGRSDLELIAGEDTAVFMVARNDSASVRPSEQGWRFVHIPHEGHDPRLDLSLIDASRVRLADYDGDGRIDVLRTNGTSLQVWRNLSGIRGATVPFGRWGVSADGTSYVTFAEPEEHCLYEDGAPLDFGDHGVRLSDMNGDGLVDIVSLRGPEIRYWPGRGNGFGTDASGCRRGIMSGGYVRMERAPADVGALDGELRLADVNGDGTDDFVQLIHGGASSAIRIWLNVDGTAVSAPATVRVGAPLSTSLSESDVTLVDIDGSATLDVLYGHPGDWRYVDLMGGRSPRLLVSVRGALGAESRTEWSTSTEDYLRDLRQADDCDVGSECDRFTWSDLTGSCDVYMEARSGVCAWRSGGSPMVRPVVRASISSDRLDVVGGVATEARTEYAYHEAGWDGAEREGRGFGVADAVHPGDAHHPTVRTRTYSYTGRRPDEHATDFFYDNGPRESVKGQSYLTEVYDETGEYLSTQHVTVRVSCPLRGLSGRLICYPYVRQTDQLAYDVVSHVSGSTFDAGSETLTLPSLELEVVPGADAGTEPAHVVRVRGARWAHTRSTVDELVGWNLVTQATAHGRVRGAWGEPLPDESITTHTAHANLASSATGWLWVSTSSYVTGHGSTAPLGLTTLLHDDEGNVVRSETTITQDQVYAFGGDGYGALDYGTPSPEPMVSRAAFDHWGQATATCFGDGDPSTGDGCLRYGTVERDDDYRRFIESESFRIRDGEWLTTTGVVHRVEGVTSVTSPDGLTASARYDGLGRLVASIPPAMNGCPPDAPSETISYHVTSDPDAEPISYIRSRVHLSCTDASDVLETVTYVDGGGGTRVTLATGEDGGAHRWVRSGITTRTARGTTRSAYQATWYGGSLTAYPALLAIPATPATWLTYDPYGRVIASYDELGALTTTSYHALSTDVCDPLDNASSSDLGSECPFYGDATVFQGTCTTVRLDGHGRVIDRILRNRQPESPMATTYERLFSEYRADGVVTRMVRAETSDESPRPWTSVVPGHELERSFSYDSAGRRVAIRDPNTDRRVPAPTATEGFVRYLYSRTGDLAAMRMPNGCGANFVYDQVGRLVGEQQVACAGVVRPPSPVDTSPPGSVGLDALQGPVPLHSASYYDTYAGLWLDPSTVAGLPPNQIPNMLGRLVGQADEGARSVVVYDERGAAYATAMQMALMPSVSILASDTLPFGSGAPPTAAVVNGAAAAVEYDESQTYVSVTGADFAGRNRWVVRPATTDGDDVVRWAGILHYDSRGLPVGATARLVIGGGDPVDDPTGSLTFPGSVATTDFPVVESVSYDIFAAPIEVVHHGGVVSHTTYDVRGLPTHVATTRTPTAMAIGGDRPLGAIADVADEALCWNAARNLVRRHDQRDPTVLPDGHRPRSVDIVHDALYRVIGAEYTYRNDTGDTTFDPYTDYRVGIAATYASDPMRPNPASRLRPVPPGRTVSQTWEFDWLADMSHSGDDAGDAPERSLGALLHGVDLPEAELRPAATYLTVAEGSWTEVEYDEAGFITTITTHAECADAPGDSCADPGGSATLSARRAALRAGCVCQSDESTQLRWDAAGRLADARRYDHELGDPEWQLGSWMRYLYSGVGRVAKWVHTPDSAGLGPPDRVALSIIPGAFERRGVVVSGGTYADDASLQSETQILVAGARIVWDHGSSPGLGVDVRHRMTMGVADVLGTTAATIDLASGELLETSTRDAQGGLETYRSTGDVGMEPRGFTGKEDDLEVGLIYFGFRYLSPRLRQWISPDPLETHGAAGGELGNPYHYVSGNVFQATDPLGLSGDQPTDLGLGEAAPQVQLLHSSPMRDAVAASPTASRCHGSCAPTETQQAWMQRQVDELGDWASRGGPPTPDQAAHDFEVWEWEQELSAGGVQFGATCDQDPAGAGVCHGLASRGVRNPHVGPGAKIIGGAAVGMLVGGPPGALAGMAGATAEEGVRAAGGSDGAAITAGIITSMGVGILSAPARSGLQTAIRSGAEGRFGTSRSFASVASGGATAAELGTADTQELIRLAMQGGACFREQCVVIAIVNRVNIMARAAGRMGVTAPEPSPTQMGLFMRDAVLAQRAAIGPRATSVGVDIGRGTMDGIGDTLVGVARTPVGTVGFFNVYAGGQGHAFNFMRTEAGVVFIDASGTIAGGRLVQGPFGMLGEARAFSAAHGGGADVNAFFVH